LKQYCTVNNAKIKEKGSRGNRGIDMRDLAETLEDMLRARGNKDHAEQMSRYMKGHFQFFGIKTPERREKPEREFQMAAIDYIEKYLKKLGKEDIYLMEKLITTKSWWDSVDTLAQKPVGTIVFKHRELIPELVEKWAVSENMWLRRTAIIFQLKYKSETDEALLYRYITLNAGSKEFFIQKGIGWALREYSKTCPECVKAFIQTHSLAPLSVREGSKYLT
jgi:3-methyladenine DNA glycosylase AlkD